MTKAMYRAVSALKLAWGAARLPMLLSLVLITVSCAIPPKEKIKLDVYNKPVKAEEEVTGTPSGPLSGLQGANLPEAGTHTTLIPPISDNSGIRKLPDLKNRFSPTEEVTVSVDTIQLSDFIHYVFNDLLNVNYVLDSKVPGQEKLSLNLKDRVTKQKLYGIVSDILAGYNTVIREKGGVYYIVPGTPQQGVEIGIGSAYTDVPDTSGQIRQLVPIRYAMAGTLVQMLLNTPGLTVYAMQNENVLVVQGARESVLQALQLIGAMDRPAMRGKYGVMFKVAYWDTKELVPKLKEILTQEGIPVAGGADGGLRLIPIDRWRILLAFSAQKEWLNRLTYWIKTLDIPEDKVDNRFFIYFPENSRAKDLCETLQNIMGISTPKTKADTSSGKNTKSAVKTAQGLQMGQTTVLPSTSAEKTSDATSANSGTGSSAISSNMAGIVDHVSVTVDDNRNALVIYTTPVYYRIIESLLKQIDVMPAQVLLEATVAEVTLSGNLKYGLEWYIEHGGDLTGTLNILNGSTKNFGGGLDYSVLNSSKSFSLMISALATDSKLKILSSPRITVRDGKSASIVVGTQVPVVTGDVATATTTTTTTGLVRSYQYMTTGITLNVTPTVHSRGVLTLQLTQGVSDATPNTTSGIDSPMISNRNLTTEVVAADGQTVMLGGLIKENNTDGVTKIPWLGDIPILGNLFRSTAKTTNRTELVVMITPRIIRSPEQIEDMRSAIMRNFEAITVEDAK